MPLFDPHPARRPAIVTGASSGIGEHTARLLAARGFPVAIGARSAGRCEEIAAEIGSAGGEAVALPLDLADADSIERFATDAGEALGRIEIVVSNAATTWPAPVLETEADAFEDLLRVNLLGPHRLVSHLVPKMIEVRRGDVVFVTSDIFRFPRPAMAAYGASKWGLEGYARTLQMELEGTGVRASIVRPGPTRTSMGRDWAAAPTEWALNEWTRWGLLRHGTLLKPEMVATAIVATVTAERGAHLSIVDVQPEGLITVTPPHEPGRTT